jgi:hypothetical protein
MHSACGWLLRPTSLSLDGSTEHYCCEKKGGSDGRRPIASWPNPHLKARTSLRPMHPMAQIVGLALAVMFCVKSVHHFSISVSTRILDHKIRASKQTLVQKIPDIYSKQYLCPDFLPVSFVTPFYSFHGICQLLTLDQ